MAKHKRNAVFVALSKTVGHELVFRHYTSKVVAAIYPGPNPGQESIIKKKRKPRAKK